MSLYRKAVQQQMLLPLTVWDSPRSSQERGQLRLCPSLGDTNLLSLGGLADAISCVHFQSRDISLILRIYLFFLQLK